MAAVESTSGRPGLAGSSARQQDFSDLSAIRDRKTPHRPENEDAMSSVAASPRSVATIEDTSGLQEHIDPDVDELLPPPAYTPQDITMQHQQHESEQPLNNRSYGSTGVADRPIDHAAAAHGDEETSMLIVRPNGQSYYVQRRRKALRRRCCACCGLIWTMRTLKALLVATTLAALIVLVTHAIIQVSSTHDKTPEYGSTPDPASPEDFLIPWPACPQDLIPRHSRNFVRDFAKLTSFSMEEGYLKQPPNNNYQNLHRVYGKIHVVSDHTPRGDMTAEFSIESTEEAVTSAIEVSGSEEQLKVDLTNLYAIKPKDALQSCTIIKMVLHVASHFDYNRISSFGLDLTHLSIELADGLYLPVTEDLTLSTVAGSVASGADMESTARRTVVHTIGGQISGVWPLDDLLYLETVSGAIDIQYLPISRPDAPSLLSKDISNASLNLTSTSGDMKAMPVNMSSTYGWPPRRFISKAKSKSGSISGYYPLGSSASFGSYSGRLDVDVLPIAFAPHKASNVTELDARQGRDTSAPQLSTATVSGTVDLRVHSTPKDHGMQWLFNATQSQHVGVSGPINLKYPSEWAGTVEASSISGKQVIEGNGLDIIESRNGWATKYVKAVKKAEDGEIGGSRVEIETLSGAVEFRLLDD